MFRPLSMLMLAGCAIFSGCASVPMAAKEQDAALKSFTAPAPDKAGIYIYRDTFGGQALKKNLYIDGVLIGESANKVYFYEEVSPGVHKVSTESEFSDNELELNTAGGKNYFLEQYIKMGLFVGGANLKAVSEEEGKKGVQSCKLARSHIGDSYKSAKALSTSTIASSTQSVSARQGINKDTADIRHFYKAEQAAASLGCTSTTFVSSGPGVEFYTAQCGDKPTSIRCDFGNCAAQ